MRAWVVGVVLIGLTVVAADVVTNSAVIVGLTAATDEVGVVELRPVLDPSSCPAAPEETVDPSQDSTLVDAPLLAPGLTKPGLLVPGAELLPTRDGGVECVGPAQGSGDAFEPGTAVTSLDPSQSWGVDVELRGGGEDTWNAIALQCFSIAPTCPTQRLAIVVDDVVQTAPTVQEPRFVERVAITGTYTQLEAEELASVLNRGVVPAEDDASSNSVTPTSTSTPETAAPTEGDGAMRTVAVVALASALVLICLALIWVVAIRKRGPQRYRR